ncbi:MAG: sel1 repeat family protein [Desulfobulbaceae bacterium]|nr:sel1 repeat family protein [Desulfobulbaceae bacterium]
MNLLKVVVSVLFLLWTIPALANDAEQEVVLQKSAAEGDAKAQYELALIYEKEAIDATDDCFEPNPELWRKAIHWLEAASDQDHLKAKKILLSKIYRPVLNREEKVKWLRLGTEMAENGHKYAQYLLAEFYYSISVGGRRYDSDPFEPAIFWYSKLLEGTGSDDTIIIPRIDTLGKEVIVADIRWNLNYLKKLSQ